MHTGQLDAFPWERALYPADVPGGIASVQVPEEHLDKIRAGRQSALNFLAAAPRNVRSITEMHAILVQDKNRRELKKLDRTIDLDLVYLEKVVPNLLREKMFARTLDCLPSREQPGVTYKEALAKKPRGKHSVIYNS